MSSYSNHRIKKQFSPKLPRYKTPTYIQRKGRTLQTSPYLIQNTKHMEFMSQEKLQKMLKTLQAYNYIPQPIEVPFRYYSFVKTDLSLEYLFNLSPITQSKLSDMASQFLSTLPPLPNNYRYCTELARFYIDYPSGLVGVVSSLMFNLIWKTDLLSNTTQHTIFSKTVNVDTPNGYHIIAQVQPFSSTQVMVTYAYCTTDPNNAIHGSNIGYTTTDFVSDDDIYYPFVSDNPSQETHGSSIEFTDIVDGHNRFTFRIQFVIYPIEITP